MQHIHTFIRKYILRIYIYVCIYMCVSYALVCTCIHMYIYDAGACVPVYHVYMYIFYVHPLYIFTFLYMYICMYACIYVCIYVCIYMHPILPVWRHRALSLEYISESATRPYASIRRLSVTRLRDTGIFGPTPLPEFEE